MYYKSAINVQFITKDTKITEARFYSLGSSLSKFLLFLFL